MAKRKMVSLSVVVNGSNQTQFYALCNEGHLWWRSNSEEAWQAIPTFTPQPGTPVQKKK